MFAWTLASPPVDHSTSVTPGKQIIWTWSISWHYCTFPQEAGFGGLPDVRQGSWNLGVWPRPQAGAVRHEKPHVPLRVLKTLYAWFLGHCGGSQPVLVTQGFLLHKHSPFSLSAHFSLTLGEMGNTKSRVCFSKARHTEGDKVWGRGRALEGIRGR